MGILQLREEIGRNRHTLDNNPIPFDWDPNINVSMYGDGTGKWCVEIEHLKNPEMSVGVKTFNNQQEANWYTRKIVEDIKAKTMNESIRKLIRKILIENLY